MARCRVGTEVQTILFPRTTFTKARAKKWAKKHGFNFDYVDIKDEYYRIRQWSPSRYKKNSFRTIPFGHSGIKAVIACPK